MKIASHEIIVVDNPLERPFMAAGVIPSSSLRHVILKLRTDDGIEGLGWSFSHSHRMLPALVSAIDDIATHIEGADPLMREAIAADILKVTGWAGEGMTHWVQATINIALWDIAGKALGQPVWKLLGGHSAETVPTYASGHMWRDYTLDELSETAGELKERGFTGMKFRCGAEATAADEGERARVVRQAVGDDVQLMIDINGGWDIPRTVAAARQFEAYDIFWLEDPIDHRDLQGYRQLVNLLDISITQGEYYYGYQSFLTLVNAGAADIVMIDTHHVGGIDGWMKAAAICNAAHRPIATHLSPEIAVHLGAAAPGVMMVEYMPWSFGLFNEPMEIDAAGRLKVPQAPGLGVSLNEDAIKRGAVTD
ncbi:MAG: mandelate racemase/muconate lactonizing enzyme family protein [Chloroflexi bacterium]|nr:mandelate racemase/muconate lactonizing enzyme family protein [Chloroflexota bacterium]